jgi:hypothetical protein
MFSVFLLLSGLLDPEGDGTLFSFNPEDEGMWSFKIWKQQPHISTDMVIEGLCVCLKVFWAIGGMILDFGTKLMILVLKRCVRTNHETSVCI